MDAAKTANDEARAAMDTAETAVNDANKAYTAAVSEKTQITSAWQSGAAAVSVGDSETGLTRQITNVAAGTNDTDAVNVAQLKAALDAAGTGLQESTDALSFKDNKLGLSIKNSDGKEIIPEALTCLQLQLPLIREIPLPMLMVIAQLLSTAQKRIVSAELITKSK